MALAGRRLHPPTGNHSGRHGCRMILTGEPVARLACAEGWADQPGHGTRRPGLRALEIAAAVASRAQIGTRLHGTAAARELNSGRGRRAPGVRRRSVVARPTKRRHAFAEKRAHLVMKTTDRLHSLFT